MLKYTQNNVNSWLYQIDIDLKWACTFSAFEACKHWSWNEWRDAVRSDVKSYARAFKRLIYSSQANASYCAILQPNRREAMEPQICPVCQYSASSKQVLSMHMLRKHATKKSIRQFTSSTYCFGCLLELHSRERLVKHVSDNERCKNFYLESVDPITLAESEELDKQDLHNNLQQHTSNGHSRAYTQGVACYLYEGPCLADIPWTKQRKRFLFNSIEARIATTT